MALYIDYKVFLDKKGLILINNLTVCNQGAKTVAGVPGYFGRIIPYLPE